MGLFEVINGGNKNWHQLSPLFEPCLGLSVEGGGIEGQHSTLAKNCRLSDEQIKTVNL